MDQLWHIVRSILLALAVAYIALVIYAYPHNHQAHLDAAAIPKIQSQKLSVSDVDGSKLPPPPDPTLVNSTVAGIDANDNGIRDDVELAIFEEYPTSSTTSTAIRAAELQYAMDLQMEFTDVTDSATLIAVIQQEGRGFLCILNDQREEDVEGLVFNTEQRKDYRESIRKKYMTSFRLDASDFCDVSINSQ